MIVFVFTVFICLVCLFSLWVICWWLQVVCFAPGFVVVRCCDFCYLCFSASCSVVDCTFGIASLGMFCLVVLLVVLLFL